MMTDQITDATTVAKEKTKKSKLTTQIKSLLLQLTAEIDEMMKSGDWDFAVRLSHYRHEFAKTHNNLDWYTSYLEIRKVRDYIKVLIGNGRKDKKKGQKG